MLHNVRAASLQDVAAPAADLGSFSPADFLASEPDAVADAFSTDPIPGVVLDGAVSIVDAGPPPPDPLDHPVDIDAIRDPVPPRGGFTKFTTFADMAAAWHAHQADVERAVAASGALPERLANRPPYLTQEEVHHILAGELRNSDDMHQSGGHGQASFIVLRRNGYRQCPVYETGLTDADKSFFVREVFPNGVMVGAVGSHAGAHRNTHTWFPTGWGAAQLQQAAALFASSPHVVESRRLNGTLTLTAYLRLDGAGNVEIGDPALKDAAAQGYIKTLMRVPKRADYIRTIFPSAEQP